MKDKVIVIYGPTASGKTSLAIKLAKEKDGELISADSRQIYKYLDIGTNKGTLQSFKVKDVSGKTTSKYSKMVDGIPIHIIDFLEPDVRFSVFEFKDLAEIFIQDILSRGKLPIIVGGTGLYIDSIVRDYQIKNEKYPQGTMLKIKNLNVDLHRLTVVELQNILTTSNLKLKTSMNPSDWNNPRRLINKILNNGERRAAGEGKYNFEFIQPEYDWDELKTKINNRVEDMFGEGIIDETKKVLEMGFSKDSVALQGTGYRQVIDYLDAKISLQECIEQVKIGHRQYARRQRTWFKKYIPEGETLNPK